MNLLERFLFDEFCTHCGERVVDDFGYVCDLCFYSLRPEPAFRSVEGLDGVFTFAPYDGVGRTILDLIKFKGAKKLIPPLAKLVSPTLRRFVSETSPDLVSFVPTHPLRVWFSRGFDQTAEFLKATGLDFVRLFNRRWVPKRPLALLKGKDRKVHIKGSFVFSFRPLEALKGKRILIVDDVITTGSTAGELAFLLHSVGVREVYLFAIFDGGK